MKLLHFVAVIIILSTVNCEEFCYDEESCGPDNWGGKCQTGLNQSPIDLPFLHLGHWRDASLDFNDQYKSNEFWIVNNGHTLQVTLESTPTSLAELSGYELDRPYIFSQLHFHWGQDDWTGSEHSLDGFQYPLEVHLVHYNSRYQNLTEAVNSEDPKALAVIGVFITDGGVLHDLLDLEFSLAPISDNIPDYNPIPTHIQESIDLAMFLPRKGQDFYRYMGSLTTPGCAEVVQWTVLRDPIVVQGSEIEKFRRIQRSSRDRPIGANHRQVQQLNGRLIQFLSMN